MASSTMGIGTSGLLSAQRQLATASHNISNVNTEGYTRQRAEQAARLPQFAGNGYIGSGVDVQTTVRIANEFLEEQIRDSNSQAGRFDAFHALATQVDNVLANPDSGLTPTIEGFFSALQEANDNPSSTPARQVLLTEANTMTERFKLLDDRFIELNDQVNQQLVDITQEISDAARSVAQLNVDIVQRIGAGQGDMPNDLMDQREVLIKKIADNIDVSVVYQDDGAANLFVGSGQSLVIGSNAATITTRINSFNAEDLDIVLQQGTAETDISTAITGGELQGVLDFKENVLEPSRRALGRVAIAITEEMNAQHRLGMTIQGSTTPFPLGQDFFTDLSGPIVGLPGQSSGNSASLSITDSQVLTTSDYQLDYDGTTVSLTRLSDNKVFTGTAGATLATKLADLNNQIDPTLATYVGTDPQGFSIASTNMAIGETYLMRPTFEGAANIGVSVNNVLDIALAGPIVSGAVMNPDGSAVNSGSGKITLPDIASLNNIPMTGNTIDAFDVTLQYADPNGGGNPGFNLTSLTIPALNGLSIDYDLNADFGGRTFAFDGVTLDSSGNPLPDFGGISFTISGKPAIGDGFLIEDNKAPFDDNRNGLLMSKLQTEKTLENSSSDFQSGYAVIVSDVGTKTHSAEIDLLAQQTLGEQAKATREAYSGVNLDEEAADLLKFQQAYQAAAKVISTADQMFQTLISSV
ncbi:MAG: flagellar hook-associated protein FlgK [Gammaproteobacteria bacterium]|nr:flagellar hook-associated protein FlgK [Gammaproteobacteria bacterium]